MRTIKKQMKENIRYLLDDLHLGDDNTVGEVLRAAEKLGVSCEYFVEEFLVFDDVNSSHSIHDDEYLSPPNLS